MSATPPDGIDFDAEKLKDHTEETYFCWKEKAFDDDGNPRLFTPWADPMQYEYAFDFQFNTEEEARAMKEDMAPDEDWVLCKETTVVVGKETKTTGLSKRAKGAVEYLKKLSDLLEDEDAGNDAIRDAAIDVRDALMNRVEE